MDKKKNKLGKKNTPEMAYVFIIRPWRIPSIGGPPESSAPDRWPAAASKIQHHAKKSMPFGRARLTEKKDRHIYIYIVLTPIDPWILLQKLPNY